MRRSTILVCLVVVAGCGPTAPSNDTILLRPQGPPALPPPAIVVGIVTDSQQHNPLSGVRMEWESSTTDYDTNTGVLTDDNGAYTMSVEPAGVLGQEVMVGIRATKDGYIVRQENVRVTLDSSRVTVNFILTPSQRVGSVRQ